MANILPDDIDLDEYRLLGRQESQWIRPASDFLEAIISRRDGTGNNAGLRAPWEKLNWLAFRPGEVTMWVGYNSHGKSLVAGQVCGWLMPECRQLIASFEMPAAATLHRMASQCAGRSDYSTEWLQEWSEFTDDRLWLYDVQERVRSDRVTGLVYYAAQELGCAQVWIDSLMQCGVPGDTRESYVRQADFIDALCRAAKVTETHVHLVHHFRKPDVGRINRPPTRYDARGASELVDRVDNCIIVYRNEGKQDAADDWDGEGDDPNNWPDGALIVDKQRHQANGTGKVPMWVHPSGQWMTRPSDRPMIWR